MPLGRHVKSCGASDHHTRCHQKVLQIELLDLSHQVQLPEVVNFRPARVLRADRDPGLGGDGAAVGSAGRSVVAWIEKFLVGSIRSLGSLVRDRVLLEGKGTDQKAAQRKQIAGPGPVVRFGDPLPRHHLRIARGLQSGQRINQQGLNLRRQRVAAPRKESFVLTIAWIMTNGMSSCTTHVSSRDTATWCSASAIVS